MSGAGKSQNQPAAAPTPKSDKIPLFVERQTYRRRRLVDGARALPVLGLVLWLVPLLWAVPESKTHASSGLIYIFAVWIGLPLVAGILIQIMKIRPRVPRNDEGET
ncbi:hypothetical protein J7443_17370 [Tropicibacter sp. R15_0]|uniref:hypothetical protein n=1 Tax=Tropicibacter sp. R15_0 TaxID=2821101 RepID=UPI001ADC3A35|nr:hypothetical protein [Tropicibacter sp. R15_0]MBO9467018.1 hypothetical protein [Tropicibacter sp. R15_0]